MDREAPGWAETGSRWRTAALAVWGVLILGVCVRGLLQPTDHNCYQEYYEQAGRNWFEGRDLYLAFGATCRYSPLINALFAPLSRTPLWLGSLLWRLVNAGAFLGALLWWLRACAPTWTPTLRALLLLSVIPLSVGNINSGQANPLLLGLLLATTAAAARGRWNWAALFCAAACLLKLYPVALALLLAGAYPRRFTPRFLIALAAGLLLPFALQHPEYVARQYANWGGNLLGDDRSQGDLAGVGYRDLWLLIYNLHLPIGPAGLRRHPGPPDRGPGRGDVPGGTLARRLAADGGGERRLASQRLLDDPVRPRHGGGDVHARGADAGPGLPAKLPRPRSPVAARPRVCKHGRLCDGAGGLPDEPHRGMDGARLSPARGAVLARRFVGRVRPPVVRAGTKHEQGSGGQGARRLTRAGGSQGKRRMSTNKPLVSVVSPVYEEERVAAAPALPATACSPKSSTD